MVCSTLGSHLFHYVNLFMNILNIGMIVKPGPQTPAPTQSKPIQRPKGTGADTKILVPLSHLLSTVHRRSSLPIKILEWTMNHELGLDPIDPCLVVIFCYIFYLFSIFVICLKLTIALNQIWWYNTSVTLGINSKSLALYIKPIEQKMSF